MKLKKKFSFAPIAAALMLVGAPAHAIPALQLGIAGGVYDWTTETVVATGPSFALYAFLIPDAKNTFGDTYYLSMAVSPKVNSPASLGSFTYNLLNTVNVTAGMSYGTPPLDSFFPDIPSHGEFPTYYKEVSFLFSGSQSGVSAKFNTQDNPTWGPLTGTGMYYKRFDMNTSGLGIGYAIHFDLYNTNLKEQCKKKVCSWVADHTQFAPFSHDAQSMTTPIPEPETYAMLLAGLGLMGFVARRRQRKLAVA